MQFATTLYAIILAERIFFFGHHALIEILALNRNPFIKAFYFSGVRLSGSYYPIHDPWRHSITKKNIKGDNLPQNTS